MHLDSDAARRAQSPSFPLQKSLSPVRSSAAAKFTNGKGHPRTDSNGSAEYTNGNSSPTIAKPLPAQWHGHDREEVTRILIQSLSDLGYPGAANQLVKESGYELEAPTVAKFRRAVLSGQWGDAETYLFGNSAGDTEGGGKMAWGSRLQSEEGRRSHPWNSPGPSNGLTLGEGVNRCEMMFWMRQQKYLELLESRDISAALMVLRNELTPLHQDMARLHSLSSLMMCKSAEDVRRQAQWDGTNGQSRKLLLSELSKSISPSQMIPDHRLAILLGEVKSGWIDKCLYHNTAESPSLYLDHMCEREDMPLNTVTTLSHHSDEVWFLAFSNDGTRLATASQDKTVIIYETATWHTLLTYTEHDAGVCYLAWSPDDRKIISCARETDNTARVWDSRTGNTLINLDRFTYAVTAAAWAPDGETFVTGAQDTDCALCVWNLQGERLHMWTEDNFRVYDLSLSPDGQRLVVLLEMRIQVYDFASRKKICDWNQSDYKLTSVNISQDSQHMLVSMNDDTINLMVIDTGEVVQGFYGHKQSKFMIRSAFGGANENFVVSGSEDSRVLIWRTNGQLVETLEAHQPACVNSVVWHPTNPHLFASAGDDKVVRIWSIPGTNSTHSNGFGT
ncbi:WD40 repeat-like protein [Eremomyces bilateralis CBS 781.70]|uniref:WD40 repeat-like protein n=1 Tax=Eremomyces bilateralis CBS 781.70 TaxID=1392243 RepID=A0A6G1FVB7_9PEZI|nr:WD40 repeat-like protein [Eremomyces bilateralis CBS 781.70]KAF1809622.1 WD40 repeat-like protein [Eremomyces bilateralis CBS 781.70]